MGTLGYSRGTLGGTRLEPFARAAGTPAPGALNGYVEALGATVRDGGCRLRYSAAGGASPRGSLGVLLGVLMGRTRLSMTGYVRG